MKNTEPQKTLTVSQWLAEIEKEFEKQVKDPYTDDHKQLIVALKAKGLGTRRISEIFKKKFGFGSREKVSSILREKNGTLDTDAEI